MGTRRIAAVLACVALLATGCSDPTAPAAPTPVPATLTDTYNDTLAVLGLNSHTFTVQNVGAVNVTLTGVSPAAALGIGVGTPSGASCNVLQSVTIIPNSAPQLVGTATITGSLCVAVFDVGNLVEPVTYTVTVFHS